MEAQDDIPTVTADNIKEMLAAVQADRDAKRVFLAMSREDQLLAILGMIAYTNNQVANMQKSMVEYRIKREGQEKNHNENLVNTGQRIAEGIQKALEEHEAKTFNVWKYMLDKVVPGLLQFIILALLALVFAKDALLALIR